MWIIPAQQLPIYKRLFDRDRKMHVNISKFGLFDLLLTSNHTDMVFRTFYPVFLTSLLLAQCAYQVNVAHHYRTGQLATCENLQPGECCRALPFNILEDITNPLITHPWFINVVGLHATDIAALWEAPGGHPGCSGRPAFTMTGPGDLFQFDFNVDRTKTHRFTGASYVTMPTRTPPDEKTSAWLSAEGMFGLVWDGGDWFSAAAKQLGVPGAKTKRNIRSPLKGTAYIGQPPRWRYPSVVSVNGTEYRSSNTSALDYRDSEGRLLGNPP